MKWTNASDRLPEFVSREKGYVVRYVKIPDNLEVWKWDWINEREAAHYDVEWLDETESPSAPVEQDGQDALWAEADKKVHQLEPKDYTVTGIIRFLKSKYTITKK